MCAQQIGLQLSKSTTGFRLRLPGVSCSIPIIAGNFQVQYLEGLRIRILCVVQSQPDKCQYPSCFSAVSAA